jgi:diphthamide biosynthesis methyltransferase
MSELPRWRTPLDTRKLTKQTTRAVKACERIMYEAYADGDTELALKATTRLQQCAQTHLKALDAADLAERVEALERALKRR